MKRSIGLSVTIAAASIACGDGTYDAETTAATRTRGDSSAAAVRSSARGSGRRSCQCPIALAA